MEKKKTEQGAIMVEAALYLPLVLCTVMALIYLALFNMQEYMLMFQAQKVGMVVAREEAYQGYSVFGMGNGKEIDFKWGEGNIPSSDTVKQYYEAHNNGIGDLYREISGVLHIAGIGGNIQGNYTRFENTARESTLLALGQVSKPEISVDYGLLGNDVKVTITHTLPMPGVIRYLGLNDQMTIHATSYTYSANPTEFARNVDLAFDMTAYIFEKLGLSDKYNGLLNKIDTVLGKIL